MGRASLLGWLDYFDRHARGPAYVQMRGLRREVWSYARVRDTAAKFATELERRGLSKGDRLILWGDDSAEWVSVFLGCMMRGVVVVPLDRVGAAEFVRRVHAEVSARWLVCSRHLAPQVADLPHVVLEDMPAIVAGHSPATAFPSLSREDPLQIIFTSGTTHEPKGVVTTHGNVLANLEPFEGEIAKYLKYERWFHPLRFLDLVPLSHVFGQFMSIFLPPLLGAVIVFPERQAPGEVLRVIKRERVSLLVAVPRMIESLQAHVERWAGEEKGVSWLPHEFAAAQGEKAWKRWWRFRALHSLFGWRFWAIVSGGATLDAASEEFWGRIGIVVLQGYGLTETTSLVSVNHPFRRGAGSIGKVLPGRDLKLSEAGEILVRGESIARNYWQGGQLRPVSGSGDEGWLRTGDLGELDAEGFLRFKGRQKNVIVTPEGMKVYPQDLENALRRDPRVRDAVVFGYSRGGNAEPAAALLLASGAEADEVLKDVNRALPPFQQLRHWYTWPEADFPRTATQKPRMADIQARAEAHFAGRTPATAPSRDGVAELLGQIRRGERSGAGDLGLTSLERVELQVALEDRYQVAISDTQFSEVQTVADLERMLSEAKPTEVSGAPRYSYPRWAQSALVQAIRVLVYHLITWPATYLLSGPRVIGREHLASVRGPVLVISNHVAYIDVGYILAALPFRLRRRLAVAMEGEIVRSLQKPESGNFLLRLVYQSSYWLMTALFNVFPLPKSSGFRESFAFAGESTERGYSVLVFPEGLRTRDGAIAPFRSGIGLLAKGLQVPVVPMRIDGLWELKKQGWRGIAPWGRIQVKVGQPTRFPADADEHAIARQLEEIVRNL